MIRILGTSIALGLCILPAAVWESLGPYRGTLVEMAVAPSDQDVIYCSTDYPSQYRMLRSTDGGNSWEDRSYFFAYCLAVDPCNPDIVYGGANTMVYRSTDGGSTWTTYYPMDVYIYAIAVHPDTPSTILAAGQVWDGWVGRFVMGFLKSTNSGFSWEQVGLNTYEGYAYALALDPSNPDIIYIGGYYKNPGKLASVYTSTDGGLNFTEVSTGLPAARAVYSLAIHPTNTGIIYAGTDSAGIYRSTNSGNTWVQVASYNLTYTLSTTTANPSIVYAGGSGAVYKSTDSGVSWSATGSDFYGQVIRGLAAHQSDATIVYAANSVGFHKTTNAGTSWFQSNYGMNLAYIPDIAVAPSSPLTIYTESVEGYGSSADGWIHKSTNNGSVWTMYTAPFDCGHICEFAVHNTAHDTLYALEGQG